MIDAIAAIDAIDTISVWLETDLCKKQLSVKLEAKESSSMFSHAAELEELCSDLNLERLVLGRQVPTACV